MQALNNAGHIRNASEQRVLGVVMQKPEALGFVLTEGLTSEHFSLEGHRLLWGVILAMWEASAPIGRPSVVMALRDAGQLDSAGGEDYLGQIGFQGLTTSGESLAFHTRQLLDAALLRDAVQASAELVDTLTRENDRSLDEQLRDLSEQAARLTAIAAGRTRQVFDATALSRIAGDALTEQLAGERPQFASSGFLSLDRFVQLPRGRVTIAAARPSHGKTIFATELALRFARRDKGQVIVFSAEMSEREMAMRLLYNLAGVPIRCIDAGDVTEDQLARLNQAQATLASLPITIDTEAKPTTAYMQARCSTLAAAGDIALVVFDYLEYTGEQDAKKDLRLEKAMLGCHEIAKRLGCPFVVVSQLNRESERRGTGTPQLSDLRYSGAIEQIAALVLMLQHPWTTWQQQGQTGEEPDEYAYLVHVRKATHGKLGSCRLLFDRETVSLHCPEEGTFPTVEERLYDPAVPRSWGGDGAAEEPAF